MNFKKYRRLFIWNNSSSMIKHETLCNDYIAGELKNVDIPNKIIALQCSWIRIIYDNSFHEWKLIPVYLIETSLKVIKPSFSLLSIDKLFWTGKSVFLWSLKYLLAFCHNICGTIEVDNSFVYFLKFSEKNINYVSQIH